MNLINLQFYPMKIGADPRSLTDFIALKTEISKQTHPARPEVNWVKVEELALLLFEKNGADLQTVAWYIFARAHLAEVSGVKEGLTLLTTIIEKYWLNVWPQQSKPRTMIINSIFLQLQKTFRAFTLNHNELKKLYETEELLLSLKALLVEVEGELTLTYQLDLFSHQVNSAVKRLEIANKKMLHTQTIQEDEIKQDTPPLTPVVPVETTNQDETSIPSTLDKAQPIKQNSIEDNKIDKKSKYSVMLKFMLSISILLAVMIILLYVL